MQLRRSPGRVWRTGLLVLIAAVCAIVGGESRAAEDRVPHIETRAPGTFDGERPVLSEAKARYQVNATVVLPLLVASIPLVSRDAVGFASAAGRDFPDEGRIRLRTYEFFAASIPGRARGLNRLGFLREAVELRFDGVRWTAHFGVISSNRESSREEAEASLDRDESVQPYTILDGFTDLTKNTNEAVDLDLKGRWPTAAASFSWPMRADPRT